MARNDSTKLIAFALVGYVGYSAAINEQLGETAFRIAKSIQNMIHSRTGDPKDPGTGDPGNGGGGNGGGNGGGGGSKWDNYNGPWGDLAVMKAANPNIESQIQTWKFERQARGQNPRDWDACRAHIIAIKAPDPGQLPPKFFFTWG